MKQYEFDKIKQFVAIIAISMLGSLLFACVIWYRNQPIEFKNEKTEYVSVWCNGIDQNLGFGAQVYKENENYFYVKSWNKYKYPKSVCKYKIDRIKWR